MRCNKCFTEIKCVGSTYHPDAIGAEIVILYWCKFCGSLLYESGKNLHTENASFYKAYRDVQDKKDLNNGQDNK